MIRLTKGAWNIHFEKSEGPGRGRSEVAWGGKDRHFVRAHGTCSTNSAGIGQSSGT